MRQHSYKNQTFSLPRKMSHLVTDTIDKELRNAYIEASKDPGQVETFNEWQETLEDGITEW